MNKLLKIKYLLAIIVISIAPACDKDFEEINTDPNSFTDVPTHFFLPGSVLSIANAENSYMDGYLYPASWVQYTRLGNWGQPSNYWYEKERSGLWNTLYRESLTDLDLMIKQAVEEENTSLEAVGLILHSYAFSLLVNAFGDVPYTEALKANEGINQPVYDGQLEIYNSILEKLRTANTLLEGETSLFGVDPDYDMIYSGDAQKWRKFCNSLRFRLLMHLSAIKDVKTELESLSPIFESEADNALFSYPGNKTGAIFPGAQSLGPAAPASTLRMAAPFINRMVGTNDPRLKVYADTVAGGEYVGVDPSLMYSEDTADEYSKIKPNRFAKNATVTFMDYSELLFLKAEAVEKGLISGSTSATLSEAIKAHMKSVGVSDSEAETFTSSLLANGTNLEEIYTEKWVSMFGRGMQAWTDYRRTGIPVLMPVTTGIIDVIPRRFTYPINEQTANKENMDVAISKLDKGDALDSKLIWTVN